ncbi:inositol monophosphatase family protein [Tautonia plasticadhaerens]|uniref:Inositol-1-monophosphatase n=1 Tax=Tautonia plasticadhaerens TaxID=2527974 RepID=A0A518H5C9_9BACT|nr:inositol monophosphatase family protein [Tautonia plasticadhaerens]QDV36033.1 Inositol-1-monophosphatase [Tautonia plasticadhaerens]
MSSIPELTVAEQAARAAGTVLARCFERGVAHRSKDVGNLVTDADLEAEHAIVAVLREAYPGHSILGEEEAKHGDLDAEHLWVVDPLDGTNNFAHRLDHFAVSVAYYRGGRAECGVVLSPIRGDLFTAVRGVGAFRNGEPARVAPHETLDQAMVGVGFYYDRGEMMEATLRSVSGLFRRNIHGIRRFGTAALDLCMVGCGQFGAFFEYQLSPWDFAAGRLFVEEAGGRVTDCLGRDLPLAVTSVLASNGTLHEEVLAVVREHLPDDRKG